MMVKYNTKYGYNSIGNMINGINKYGFNIEGFKYKIKKQFYKD